ADVEEPEPFSHAEVAHQGRREDLAGLGVAAGARGELDAGTEEVPVVLDGLARAEADADVERGVFLVLVVHGELLLGIDRALDGAAGLGERGPDAVAGMLLLLFPPCPKRPADRGVVAAPEHPLARL